MENIVYEKKYDVIVVGAGHAGIEAALASARMGRETLLLTISLDTIGRMSCNPAIGGPAKSQLVSEIDALGGEMGKAADATYLQMKLLNTSKGPAVQALRAQSDRKEYEAYMKKVVENQELLDVKQGEVIELVLDGKNFSGVRVSQQFTYLAKAAVLATGTFLDGMIFTGMEGISAGRAGEPAANRLTGALNAIGVRTGKLKTGTVPRLDKRTIDFSKLEEAPGLSNPRHFSFDVSARPRPQHLCWLTRTSLETHRIILDNLDRSPLYQGAFSGTGPRYCPSIEDKVVRFSDKESHLLFLEPEGVETNEMYLQGLATSLPLDVQKAVVNSLPGLEQAEIMRPGYAIEYSFIFPEQLNRTLMLDEFPGIFSAGQLNGTSGYEEAAAQGLLAGANAALFSCGQDLLTLSRENSYIGTLIDDLITKEIREPYRMLTSRSEYRLFLRQDNADLRLSALGRRIGLVSEEKEAVFVKKRQNIEKEIENLRKNRVKISKKEEHLLKNSGGAIKSGTTFFSFLQRPQLSYDGLLQYGYTPAIKLSDNEKETLSIEVKYEGYIATLRERIVNEDKLAKKRLSKQIDYFSITGLRNEAKEKLAKILPDSVAQAKQIAGVNPADIAVLLVWLKKNQKKNSLANEVQREG